MPSPADCEREIVRRHDCFVRWYRGRTDEAAFERVERALDPAFEQVAPDGTLNDRATVLAGIRDAYDTRETSDIEIRNVESVAVGDRHTLVRYEEWQSTGTGETGRHSTALFGPGDERAPPVRWLHLQETWLEPPNE